MSLKRRKILAPCLRFSALTLSLISGYYRRAFAGTCAGAGGVYSCSGAAVPGVDLQQTLSNVPLTVTITPGFGINVTTVGKDAFDLSTFDNLPQVGSITFTDNNASVITGKQHGINGGSTGSGGITITSNGSITGTTGTGIRLENWGGQLNISAASVAGGTDGIYARNLGTGLTVSAANVSGGLDGIFAINQHGALAITTSGTVSGTTKDGIHAENSGTNLTISSADVSGGVNGIFVKNSGSGPLAISSSGAVTGTTMFGIYAKNYGTGLTVSAADVFGGVSGIRTINQGSGALSITASGPVTGSAGIGIVANNYGTDLGISAAGVSGWAGGIFAVNAGTGAMSISASDTVSGRNLGIQAENSGTDLTISAADVSCSRYLGILASNFGSGALSISASGPVTGGLVGIYGGNFGTDLTVSAADVSGGLHGIDARNLGSGALAITASGKVTGTTAYGIYAENSGTNLTISAANVSGGTNGIDAANSGSGALTITAGGTVSGTAGDGIFALNSGGGPTSITVTPTGIVEGGLAGIDADSPSGQPVLIDVFGQARNLSGQPADTAISVSGGPVTVNLHTDSLTTGVVNLGDQGDTVNLAGTVNGSIRLNGGDDTLIQSGGSLLTGIADGGSGTDTLSFSNMGILDGSHYLNFENLEILGGATTLTGTWDFSGGVTTIHQGSLYVNGNLLTQSLTVDNDGLLGGNGHIFGDIAIYGTVSPGNSIGTLDVTGPVGFMPGSTLVAQLGADGSGDLLRVDGAVSINGARLETSLAPGVYRGGQSWQVIEASGGISGQFSSIGTNFTSSTIALAPVYGGGSLDLVISRTPYASFGRTSNQAAMGGALDALLPSAHGMMADFLAGMDFDLNAAGISATLAGLNPEMYTAFPSAGLAVVKNFDRIVALRQQESQAPDYASDNPEKLWNLWGQAFGNWLDRDGANGISGYTVDTGGTVFGLDRVFFSRLRAGVEMGYGSSNLSWDTRGNNGHIDAKHIGLYASTLLGGFHLEGAAGYTGLDESATRSIATPLFTARTAAGFNGNVWNATLTGGYDFTLGPLRLGPVATVDYRHLDQDGVSENGAGDLAVRLRSATFESLKGSLGLRAAATLHQADWRFLPRASLALAREFKDDPVRLTANFADYPNAAFTVAGPEQPRNQILARAGLTIYYSRCLSIFLDLSSDLASHQNNTLLTGGLAWNF